MSRDTERNAHAIDLLRIRLEEIAAGQDSANLLFVHGVEAFDLVGVVTQKEFKFPDSRAPGEKDYVMYFQDGVLLRKSDDYRGGSGGVITLTTAPGAGFIHCVWIKLSNERVQAYGRPWMPPRMGRRDVEDEVRRTRR